MQLKSSCTLTCLPQAQIQGSLLSSQLEEKWGLQQRPRLLSSCLPPSFPHLFSGLWGLEVSLARPLLLANHSSTRSEIAISVQLTDEPGPV